jgi:hypothetical protein
LGTLNYLIVAYGDEIGSSAYEVIIVELSTLIRFCTPLTLCFCGFLERGMVIDCDYIRNANSLGFACVPVIQICTWQLLLWNFVTP